MKDLLRMGVQEQNPTLMPRVVPVSIHIYDYIGIPIPLTGKMFRRNPITFEKSDEP